MLARGRGPCVGDIRKYANLSAWVWHTCNRTFVCYVIIIVFLTLYLLVAKFIVPCHCMQNCSFHMFVTIPIYSISMRVYRIELIEPWHGTWWLLNAFLENFSTRGCIPRRCIHVSTGSRVNQSASALSDTQLNIFTRAYFSCHSWLR